MDGSGGLRFQSAKRERDDEKLIHLLATTQTAPDHDVEVFAVRQRADACGWKLATVERTGSHDPNLTSMTGFAPISTWANDQRRLSNAANSDTWWLLSERLREGEIGWATGQRLTWWRRRKLFSFFFFLLCTLHKVTLIYMCIYISNHNFFYRYVYIF